MHLIKKYIEKLDETIEELIAKEASDLAVEREKLLHILFENREHVCEWRKQAKED